MPVCTHRAFHEDTLYEGFFRNGQLDRESEQVLDIYDLIGTKRGNWDLPRVVNMNRADDRKAYDTAKYNLHKEHFRDMFNKFYMNMYGEGHIDEHNYDINNIPMDTNSNGIAVEKNQGISQENRQRAKIPSHNQQRQLRLANLEYRKNEKKRIQKKHYDDEQKHFKLNRECETLLKAQIQMDEQLTNRDVAMPLQLLEPRHFGEKKSSIFPSTDQLKAFIRVRSERKIMKGKPRYSTVNGKRSNLVIQAIAKKLCNIPVPCIEEPMV